MVNKKASFAKINERRKAKSLELATIPVVEAELVEAPENKQKTKTGKTREIPSNELAKIVSLLAKGVSIRDVAKATGRSKISIERIKKRFGSIVKAVKDVPEYQQFRNQILNGAEAQLLKAVTDPTAVRKAPLNQRAYALDVIFKARRLEDGQSTANLSHAVSLSEANLKTYVPK